MTVRKLIAAAMLSLLVAGAASAQAYGTLFEQAQAYEDAGQYIHALGSYWDAMNAAPSQAQGALTAYNRLSALIQSGKPGQDKSYDAFDLYDGWMALYRDYQQYWQEHCPFGFTIGTPQLAGLDMASRTAQYRVGAWSWESSKYRHIKDIVSEGYGKSRSSGWSGIPSGWTDASSEDYSVQFGVSDRNGTTLLTSERKAVGDYTNFEFKGVSRNAMKAIDAGGSKITPSGVWLKSGRSWKASEVLFSTEGGVSPDRDALAETAALFAAGSAGSSTGTKLSGDAASWKASAEQYKKEAATWKAAAEQAQAEAKASKAAETRAIKEAAAWKSAAEDAQAEAKASKAAEAQAKSDAAAWKAAAEQSMADARTRTAEAAQAKKDAASWQSAAQNGSKTSTEAQRTADIARFASCAALAAEATENTTLAYYEFDSDTALATGRMYSALLVSAGTVDAARLKEIDMDIHELCNFASIRDGLPAAYVKDASGTWKESGGDSYRYCKLPAGGSPSAEDAALKDIFEHAPGTFSEAVRAAISAKQGNSYVLVRSGSEANKEAAEAIAEARANKKPETLQEGIDKMKVYKDKGVNKVKDLFGKNKDKTEEGSK